MSFDINKHISLTLSTIIFNKPDIITNNIKTSNLLSPEITQLYNNLINELTPNKQHINETTIKSQIIQSKTYKNFIYQKFLDFYIKYFDLSNNDINIQTKQEILNIIDNNSSRDYYNINFEYILLNSKIINEKINIIINKLIIKIFNINYNHNENNNDLHYLFKNNIKNLNFKYIIYNIYLKKIIDLQSNIHNANIIHIYKVLFSITDDNKENPQLQIENILKDKNGFNTKLNEYINSDAVKSNNKIYEIIKDKGILNNALSYIEDLQNNWFKIYNYEITSYKFFNFLYSINSENYFIFNNMFTNNLFSNNLNSFINHIYFKYFNRNMNLFEYSKYYSSFVFIIYNNLEAIDKNTFKYNNILDIYHDEFVNYSNDKINSNYHNIDKNNYKKSSNICNNLFIILEDNKNKDDLDDINELDELDELDDLNNIDISNITEDNINHNNNYDKEIETETEKEVDTEKNIDTEKEVETEMVEEKPKKKRGRKPKGKNEEEVNENNTNEIVEENKVQKVVEQVDKKVVEKVVEKNEIVIPQTINENDLIDMIISTNNDDVSIINNYIKNYDNKLINDLDKYIHNIKQNHDETFNVINLLYKDFLHYDLDYNTFFNKYLLLIDNPNYKDLIIDKIVNTNVYKQNVIVLIRKIFMEYYEMRLDDFDIKYLFNLIYLQKLPVIETPELRDIVKKVKLDTDEYYKIITQIFLEILKREPDINEILYYKNLFRRDANKELSINTLKNDLYDNIEYHEILKTNIKKIYNAMYRKDILPSILYKTLNLIIADNELKKDFNKIKEFIQNLKKNLLNAKS